MDERLEAFIRVGILLVSGIVLKVWLLLVTILVVINFIFTLFTNRRDRSIAEFCEMWSTQLYIFLRYITFVSNERPFPFRKLTTNMSRFGK